MKGTRCALLMAAIVCAGSALGHRPLRGLSSSKPAVASASSASTGSAVVISALAYHGYDGNNDEAVQLTNVSSSSVVFDANWSLRDASNRMWTFPAFTLPAGERVWIARNPAAFARQFGFTPTISYTSLIFANAGGSITLQRTNAVLLDSANTSGGSWDAGSGSPTYRSMERIDAGAPDTAGNWADANVLTSIAFDAGGNPIAGTPRAANSVAGLASPTTLTVVINEVAWGGTRANPNHEWIELYNNSADSITLTGWQITSSGGDRITLNGVIAGNGYFLIQRDQSTFSSGAVADQTASFSLSNAGETLRLINANAEVVDALVYGDGAVLSGWVGPPLQPYTVTQTIPDDGQILMRRLDPATGLPVADTDTAQDWFNHRGDPADARKPIYPGWQVERFFIPASDSGSLKLAIAPDNSYDVVRQTLAAAARSIDLASFTFEHARLGELLADKAAAGVVVRVLLDGAPVGGLKDQTRWICQRITSADPTGRSGCWFMRSVQADKINARYAFLHAKFAIVDEARLLIGSENFGPRGLPDDDKSDGTAGQRGTIAVTDAPAVVARARAIFEADINPAHPDIIRWCATCAPYGPPPAGFTPDYTSGGISYTVRFAPLEVAAPVSMTLLSSPENHLASTTGIIGLINLAGAGDEILIEQLDEPHYWGATSSAPGNDPNPRLLAILNAAARGARVRMLLDRHYDAPTQPRSNDATVRYVLELARINGWDVQAATGNPTGLGVHNKLILLRLGNRHFALIGSWNGSEVSAKRNREMSVLVESSEAYAYLRTVFMHDFQLARPVYLPIVSKDHRPAGYPLISEVLFNPSGGDESGREWIEVYNPTPLPISIGGYKIGDAAVRGSTGEGMVAFPSGAILQPGRAIVIAQNAAAFFADWGKKPDYELSDYDPAVPELSPYTAWAQGTINLANAGDEVVLLDKDDRIVDAVVWLSGNLNGITPYPVTIPAGHTLQRWPPNLDTDNCATDFRAQAIPSPGLVP
ncbi:MAG: lamin tail domain-containing protein [Anaerolineae bacterium]|nr:lamin tail domain-containing protein [Candidatus Roseilinea sp.]MDW8449854.1 lamin tail domain-containing protein [Anaerolineae bacterium]